MRDFTALWMSGHAPSMRRIGFFTLGPEATVPTEACSDFVRVGLGIALWVVYGFAQRDVVIIWRTA